MSHKISWDKTSCNSCLEDCGSHGVPSMASPVEAAGASPALSTIQRVQSAFAVALADSATRQRIMDFYGPVHAMWAQDIEQDIFAPRVAKAFFEIPTRTKANGQATSQANDSANGPANGQANGQANGPANGPANGQANGQANETGNDEVSSTVVFEKEYDDDTPYDTIDINDYDLNPQDALTATDDPETRYHACPIAPASRCMSRAGSLSRTNSSNGLNELPLFEAWMGSPGSPLELSQDTHDKLSAELLDNDDADWQAGAASESVVTESVVQENESARQAPTPSTVGKKRPARDETSTDYVFKLRNTQS